MSQNTGLRDYGDLADNNATPFDLEDLPELELISLQERIAALLPIKSLGKIDVRAEVLAAYRKAKLLHAEATSKDSIATTAQKVQATNSLASNLVRLANLQNALFDSEMMKRAEMAIIKAMKDQPEDVKRKFFDTYKTALDEIETNFEVPDAESPSAAD